MNSRAPISGLERPSRASGAICASCGVSTPRRLVGALRDGLAGGQQLAAGALGERLGADVAERVVGSAQVLARVHAAVLTTQPLAVHELRSGELSADPGAGEPLDRLAVERLRGVAIAQEGPRARLDAERPVRAAGSCRLREPLERLGRELGRATVCGRLDELDQAPSR